MEKEWTAATEPQRISDPRSALTKRIQLLMQKRASNYRIVLFARTGPWRAHVSRFAHGSSVTVVCRGKPSVNPFFPGPSPSTFLRPRLSTLENRLPTLAGRFYVKSSFRARQPRHRDVAVLRHRRRRRESIINAERSLARLAANDRSSSPSM